MSDFKLTLDELEVGKEYNKLRAYNNNVIFYIDDTDLLKIKGRGVKEYASIRKGDRFKEIKKEIEFVEMKCFRAGHSGNFIFTIASNNVNTNYTEQDYKIENGKLFVKDLNNE